MDAGRCFGSNHIIGRIVIGNHIVDAGFYCWPVHDPAN